MVHGLPHLEESNGVCEGCMIGKQHRNASPTEFTWRAKFPLELVHTNIYGQIHVESNSGCRLNQILGTSIFCHSHMAIQE